MTIEEIKKELYKQKPEAHLKYIKKGFAYYKTSINQQEIEFKIPLTEMLDADFLLIMDAKLLNRWIEV